MNQNELKNILNYDPISGIFTWKNKNIIAGNINDRGYRLITINRKTYRAHRLAWLYVYGDWPKNQIDHINTIRNDNRIENLREATGQENCYNRNKPINNTSGYKNIYYDKSRNKWRIIIKHSNGFFRKRYNNLNDAINEVDGYLKKYHGEFARLI